MVKSVQVITWDDLDHYQKGIETPGAETYSFGWAGQDWEIDLTEAHFKEMAEALRPWLECARPAEKADTSQANRTSRTRYVKADGSPDWGAKKQRTRDLAKVRKWATEVKGITLPNRGGLSKALQREYNAANPYDRIPIITSQGPVDE
jgi:hypothetical protein